MAKIKWSVEDVDRAFEEALGNPQVKSENKPIIDKIREATIKLPNYEVK